MLSNGLLSTEINKTKNTAKLETEKIHLQKYQCLCSFFYSVIWEPCVCQAGCWTWRVFDLNRCNLNRCLVVGAVGEHRWECQLWVQKDGCLEDCVSISCPYMLLLPAAGQWWVPKDSNLTQAEPALVSMWVPQVLFDVLEVPGQRGYQGKKKITNAKRFADCTSGNPQICYNYLNIKL